MKRAANGAGEVAGGGGGKALDKPEPQHPHRKHSHIHKGSAHTPMHTSSPATLEIGCLCTIFSDTMCLLKSSYRP